MPSRAGGTKFHSVGDNRYNQMNFYSFRFHFYPIKQQIVCQFSFCIGFTMGSLLKTVFRSASHDTI